MVADDHDTWDPEKLRPRPLRSIVGWIIAAISVYVAAGLVPGVTVDGTLSAFLTAAVIAIFNAIAAAHDRGAAPAVHPAARLPARARRRRACTPRRRRRFPDHVSVAAFRDALLAALVIAAVSMVLGDRGHQRRRHLHAARDPADRPPRGRRGTDDRRHHLPRDRRPRDCPSCAGRSATATPPTMARWLADGTHQLVEWEPDLSSQTGASQAGILLGSNEDIPAFRWVEKETGRVDDLLEARRLRRDRAPPRDRHRAAGQRRREPRQPALGRGRRGDPDGQPDAAPRSGQPRLPRRSSPTASTSPARWCCSSGRSSSSGPPRAAPSAATCDRAATAAASTRSCAARCA